MSTQPVHDRLRASVPRVLDRIDAAFVREEYSGRLSVRDRVKVVELLERRPELQEDTERLKHAMAALLAKNPREAERIRGLFDQEYGPPEGDSGRGSSRKRVGMGIVLAGTAAAGICMLDSSEEPIPGGPDGGAGVFTYTATRTAIRTAIGWQVQQIASSTTVVLESETQRRPLDRMDALGATGGLLLAFLGFLIASTTIKERDEADEPKEAPAEEPGEPSKIGTPEDEARAIEALKKLEPELKTAYYAKRASLARASPLRRGAVVEAANYLSALRYPTPGRELDVVQTAKETSDSGGLFRPILYPRSAPRALIVFVDVESGDYVWLGAFRRVLFDLQRQGVSTRVYEFQFGFDRTLRAEATGQDVPIRQVAQMEGGQPVVIFSRRLDRDLDSDREPRWLQALIPWSAKAWLDPDPVPLERRGSRRRVVKALEAAGLVRFPFTEAGLVALCRFVASDGQSTERAAWPILLPSAPSPGLERALIRWATAAALIPDASWDDVQWVRHHPDLIRWFPNHLYVDVLLRWIQQTYPEAHAGDLGSGPMLDLSRKVVDGWIRAARSDPSWERLWRERWIEALEKQDCPTKLDDLRAKLRIARHRAFLDPEGAEAELLSSRGTAVHFDMVRDLEQLRTLGPIPRAPEPEAEDLPEPPPKPPVEFLRWRPWWAFGMTTALAAC